MRSGLTAGKAAQETDGAGVGGRSNRKLKAAQETDGVRFFSRARRGDGKEHGLGAAGDRIANRRSNRKLKMHDVTMLRWRKEKAEKSPSGS